MNSKTPFKTSFLSIFKPLSVTVLIVMAIECLQLLQAMSYYDYIVKEIEVFQLCALFFLSGVVTATLLSMTAALLMRFRLIRANSLAGACEVLCVSIVILVWLPGLIIVFTKDFPSTMKFFWLTYYGLIPAATVLSVITIKLFFKKKFRTAFNRLLDTFWKPTVIIMAASLLFFVITVAAANLFTTGKGDSPSYTTEIADDACEDADLPNIIVISFDSLSAQDMSLYGYALPTTPFWEELARFSFVFDRAHANSNRTLPSITTLLTGKYPWTHGVYKEGDQIEEDLIKENLLALLPEYCSAAIISTNYTYPQYMGLDNQFDYVRWSNKGNSFAMTALTRFLERSLRAPVFQISMPIFRHYFYLRSNDNENKEIYGETLNRSGEFLKKLSKRPFFLWTHIWPPHLPYLPPAPFMKKFLPIDDDDSFMLLFPAHYKPSQQHLVDKLKLRYDEFVLFSDYLLKKFIRELIDLNLYDDSIIIVLGDHGEAFEKLWFSHGGHLLNEPVIHVPILIKMPRQNSGLRIKAVAGVVDIAPTILDLLERPVPDWMDGESLVPYMKGERTKALVTKYSMINAEFSDMTVDLVAAYRDDYKLIYNLKTKESLLYDMSKDVSESTDLKDVYPEIARALKRDIMKDINRRYFDE